MKKIFLFVCTLSSVFGDIYPQKALDSLLFSYNQEEKEAIDEDYQSIKNIIFPKEIADERIYIATAGPPGAGKSTLFELFLRKNFPHISFAYIDPDQWTMRYMIHTYYQRSLNAADLIQYTTHLEATKAAYEKWRDASNYISKSLFNEACLDGISIAHGTTSTSSFVPDLYEKLHEKNYKIHLALVAATPNFCNEAIKIRQEERKYYQSTLKDENEKARWFLEKIPIYFKYADQIYLFWHEDFPISDIPIAIFTKQGAFYYNKEAFARFVDQYETARARSSREDLPSMEVLIQQYLDDA
ncbi:MAG: zeta toxin family protein [Chlamydiota bacterium]